MDITKVTVKKVPSTVGMGIMVVINTRTKVQITMVVVTMLVVVILNMGIHRMVNMVVEIQAYQQQVAIIGIKVMNMVIMVPIIVNMEATMAVQILHCLGKIVLINSF